MKWERVFKSPMEVRAEIVKSILETHDMPAVVMNKKDSNYHFGYFEVQVAHDHVQKALKIIDEEVRFE